MARRITFCTRPRNNSTHARWYVVQLPWRREQSDGGKRSSFSALDIFFFLSFSSSSAFYSSRLISSWRNLRTGFQMKSTRRAIDRSHDLRVYTYVCVCTYTYTYTYIHTYVSLSRRKSEMGAVSCVLEKYQDPVRFRFVRSIKTVYTRVCMCVCVCGLLNREITSSCSRQILKNHKSRNDSKKTIR